MFASKTKSGHNPFYYPPLYSYFTLPWIKVKEDFHIALLESYHKIYLHNYQQNPLPTSSLANINIKKEEEDEQLTTTKIEEEEDQNLVNEEILEMPTKKRKTTQSIYDRNKIMMIGIYLQEALTVSPPAQTHLIEYWQYKYTNSHTTIPSKGIKSRMRIPYPYTNANKNNPFLYCSAYGDAIIDTNYSLNEFSFKIDVESLIKISTDTLLTHPFSQQIIAPYTNTENPLNILAAIQVILQYNDDLSIRGICMKNVAQQILFQVPSKYSHLCKYISEVAKFEDTLTDFIDCIQKKEAYNRDKYVLDEQLFQKTINNIKMLGTIFQSLVLQDHDLFLNIASKLAFNLQTKSILENQLRSKEYMDHISKDLCMLIQISKYETFSLHKSQLANTSQQTQMYSNANKIDLQDGQLTNLLTPQRKNFETNYLLTAKQTPNSSFQFVKLYTTKQEALYTSEKEIEFHQHLLATLYQKTAKAIDQQYCDSLPSQTNNKV